MSENNLSQNKRVLLLFPWRGLGEKISTRYLSKKYELILFVLDEKDRSFYLDMYKDSKDELQIITIEAPIPLFWEKLPDTIKKRATNAQIVINFVGKDFIKLQVDEKGMGWKINVDNPIQIRLAFIDKLLKEFDQQDRNIWINLVYGTMGHSTNKDIFCSTRYGIAGLNNIMLMNPRLSEIEIVNICLSFLKLKAHKIRMAHCSHCISEKFEDELVNVEDEEDFAEFLINKSSQLLSSNSKKNVSS